MERLASGLGPDLGQLLYLHTFVLVELQPEEVSAQPIHHAPSALHV
jgi:hypothetical protein